MVYYKIKADLVTMYLEKLKASDLATKFVAPKKIGNGNFGTAYSATFDGNPVVLKIVAEKDLAVREAYIGYKLHTISDIAPFFLSSFKLYTYGGKVTNTTMFKPILPDKLPDTFYKIDKTEKKGFYILVQEYGMGKTGAQWLESQPSLSSATIRSIMFQLTLALAYAKSSIGFQHNDLKLENIMITTIPAEDTVYHLSSEGDVFTLKDNTVRVQIFDFGLSSLRIGGDDVNFDFQTADNIVGATDGCTLGILPFEFMLVPQRGEALRNPAFLDRRSDADNAALFKILLNLICHNRFVLTTTPKTMWVYKEGVDFSTKQDAFVVTTNAKATLNMNSRFSGTDGNTEITTDAQVKMIMFNYLLLKQLGISIANISKVNFVDYIRDLNVRDDLDTKFKNLAGLDVSSIIFFKEDNLQRVIETVFADVNDEIGKLAVHFVQLLGAPTPIARKQFGVEEFPFGLSNALYHPFLAFGTWSVNVPVSGKVIVIPSELNAPLGDRVDSVVQKAIQADILLAKKNTTTPVESADDESADDTAAADAEKQKAEAGRLVEEEKAKAPSKDDTAKCTAYLKQLHNDVNTGTLTTVQFTEIVTNFAKKYADSGEWEAFVDTEKNTDFKPRELNSISKAFGVADDSSKTLTERLTSWFKNKFPEKPSVAAVDPAAEKKVEEEAAAKKKVEEEAAVKKKVEDEAAAKKKVEEEAAVKNKQDEEEAAATKPVTPVVPSTFSSSSNNSSVPAKPVQQPAQLVSKNSKLLKWKPVPTDENRKFWKQTLPPKKGYAEPLPYLNFIDQLMRFDGTERINTLLAISQDRKTLPNLVELLGEMSNETLTSILKNDLKAYTGTPIEVTDTSVKDFLIEELFAWVSDYGSFNGKANDIANAMFANDYYYYDPEYFEDPKPVQPEKPIAGKAEFVQAINGVLTLLESTKKFDTIGRTTTVKYVEKFTEAMSIVDQSFKALPQNVRNNMDGITAPTTYFILPNQRIRHQIFYNSVSNKYIHSKSLDTDPEYEELKNNAPNNVDFVATTDVFVKTVNSTIFTVIRLISVRTLLLLQGKSAKEYSDVRNANQELFRWNWNADSQFENVAQLQKAIGDLKTLISEIEK